MKIRASLSKPYGQWRNNVKARASTRRMSLMLGYDSDETQLVLKVSYSRRDDKGLKGNVE